MFQAAIFWVKPISLRLNNNCSAIVLGIELEGSYLRNLISVGICEMCGTVPPLFQLKTVNEETPNCLLTSACARLRKSLLLNRYSLNVRGSKSPNLGINGLSEVRANGKKAMRLCFYF